MCPSPVKEGARRGWMAPIGGAEARQNDPQILRRFAGLCGGDNADFVVIPTASRMKDAGRH